MNSEGKLVLMGRLKHCIVHEGKTNYLFPLEAKLKEFPNLIESTYISKNDTLILVIEGNDVDKQQLKDYLKNNNMPVPYKIIFSKIPRDPRHNSKIDYESLKTSV